MTQMFQDLKQMTNIFTTQITAKSTEPCFNWSITSSQMRLFFSEKKSSHDYIVPHCRGATTSSELGVQFLGLGYYYPSTEKIKTDLPSSVQSVTKSHSIHQKAT